MEVFGPPSVQKAVGALLKDVAATANTRIGLDVAVYFVDSDRADEFGVSANITGRAGELEGGLLAAATGGPQAVSSCHGAMTGFLSRPSRATAPLLITGSPPRWRNRAS